MKKNKRERGILEDLYLHIFNEQKFDSFTSFSLDKKTETILHDYQELIKEYSPEKLEKEGKVPGSLWDGLKKIGLFDETLVAANDDAEMSMRMIKHGVKIRFNPAAVIYHEARTSLISFTKWMYDRARQMQVPFMAGSSLPLSFRKPEIDVPMGCEIDAEGVAAVVVVTRAHWCSLPGFRGSP